MTDVRCICGALLLDPDDSPEYRRRGYHMDLSDCPYAPCDDPTCTAKLNPQTVEELQAAVKHWRSHSFLCGCSHSR